MENINSPIGIFDSGLGGLSILNEISKRLPNEDIIYLADSVNAPYGEKPREDIIRISKKNADYLAQKSCKLIVVACNTATTNAIQFLRVACNTATTNAIQFLRSNYNIPFIGIEPAMKPAILNSKNSKVGVLATKGTLSSELFAQTSKKFKTNTEIIEVIGKGIVEAIETNTTDLNEFNELLKKQLIPFKEKGIDTLVLGCTHYPLIMKNIIKHMDKTVHIIDSGYAVAKQTEKILFEKKICSNKTGKGDVIIITNDTSLEALNTVLAKLKLDNAKIISN